MKKIAAALLVFLVMMALAPVAMAQAPVFTITDWETDVETIVSGGEFTLTFTFTNTGTSGADEVVANVGPGAFVALGPGARWGHLGIGDTNTATLRVGVAGGLITGPYSLPIEFNYHGPYGGPNMVFMTNIGVEVIGMPAFGDTGRPQLVIEESFAEFIGSGQVDLVLSLRNTGNRAATNIALNLMDNPDLAPVSGSSAVAIEGDIAPEETVEVRIPMLVSGDASERVTQGISLEYSSRSGGIYSGMQSIPLELGLPGTQRPHLLIDSYTTEPSAVSPGDNFTLTLSILNVGSGAAEQIFVRLGENAASLGPLAPIGSSNLRYLELIEGHETASVTFDLMVDGGAPAGLVALDVMLAYTDERGSDYTEPQAISLLVATAPRLLVQYYYDLPSEIEEGDVIDLPIEIINMGSGRLNISTAEVTSEGLDITNASAYIGPLDAGTSGVFEPYADVVESGEIELVVSVHYTDDLQQEQVYTQTLTLSADTGTGGDRSRDTARSGEEDRTTSRRTTGGSEGTEAAGGPTNMFLRALLGFFGLGTVNLD